ncbi:hypothetical protein IPM62_00830 [Candidatus Woesebacteria bacterium]|nr:MAG: hypothetical protein IPM62_00830 [Candidatus Woesebacteria bacterium]
MTSKIFLSLFLAVLAFSISSKLAMASIVVVESSGELIVNVLSLEDESGLEIPVSEQVTVTSTASSNQKSDSTVTLTKENGLIVLNVETDGASHKMDVSDYRDEVVKIEERPQVNKMSIFIKENKFNIEESGVRATTDYEITVDPASARLMLNAPSGKRFLSVNPKEATQTLLRAKTLTKYDNDGVTIEEIPGGDLAYKIAGAKEINVFNFYTYPVSITASVSALTGEIVAVDQPSWFRVIGFLFS